jgi:hypothetical protein
MLTNPRRSRASCETSSTTTTDAAHFVCQRRAAGCRRTARPPRARSCRRGRSAGLWPRRKGGPLPDAPQPIQPSGTPSSRHRGEPRHQRGLPDTRRPPDMHRPHRRHAQQHLRQLRRRHRHHTLHNRTRPFLPSNWFRGCLHRAQFPANPDGKRIFRLLIGATIAIDRTPGGSGRAGVAGKDLCSGCGWCGPAEEPALGAVAVEQPQAVGLGGCFHAFSDYVEVERVSE